MSEFLDSVTDIAEIIAADGDFIDVTTGSRTYRVPCFWEGQSIAGGDQEGPRIWIAAADMPDGWTQSDTIVYNGTTYVMTHKEPDGHGLVMVTLTDETTL